MLCTCGCVCVQLHILYDASDGEDGSDEEDYEPPAQRRRVSQSEYGSMSPDSQRERRKWLKRLTRRYYASSWHGTSASLLCYSLVQSLNKAANELLWLAIVGLTDQLVHERIEYEKYVGEAQALQAEVTRRPTHSPTHTPTHTPRRARTSRTTLLASAVGAGASFDVVVHAAARRRRAGRRCWCSSLVCACVQVGALNQDGGDETREVAGEEGGQSVSVRQHIASRLRIDSVQELRLSLMRHWTVYEALRHSPYIASRLGLYQQAGRDKLDVWLARMGIPCTHAPPTHAPTPRPRTHPRPAHACTHAPFTHAPTPRPRMHPRPVHACTMHASRTQQLLHTRAHALYAPRTPHAPHTRAPHTRPASASRVVRTCLQAGGMQARVPVHAQAVQGAAL
jgi:hypothetical protein